MRQTGQQGLYELVIVRVKSIQLRTAIFVAFPNLNEYHTKDCFLKHATKPDLWKHESRIDDILVLSSGEKLNPILMENIIYGCPVVKGCVATGQARFQASLLVEPKNPDIATQDLWQSFEPYFDRANKTCLNYSCISRARVILTGPLKPLPRAAKGTAQRAANYALYEKEIGELYTRLTPATTASKNHTLQLASAEIAQADLRTYLSAHLRIPERDISTTEDRFAFRMDHFR
jgi:hypothetical protein